MEKVHFEDLTKINVPFGLLDEDTQTRMKEWEHGWECFTGYGNNGGWVQLKPNNSLNHVTTSLRAKSAPLTQDTVPWHLLEPRWQWYARDEDGNSWVFGKKPEISLRYYWACDDAFVNLSAILKDHKIGTVDWKDSLQQRPEGV